MPTNHSILIKILASKEWKIKLLRARNRINTPNAYFRMRLGMNYVICAANLENKGPIINIPISLKRFFH